MNVAIVHATRDHAPFLPAIERSAGALFRTIPGLAWIADDSIAQLQDHLEAIDARASWVAIDESGQPVGFLIADTEGSALHIWEVSVHAEAQGHGIGRRLIEAAVAEASSQRHSAVTLTTFREVPWNEPYYHRLGFVTLGPDEIDDKLAAIFADEVRRGLPAERRCAMRLDLATLPDAV